MKKIDMKKPEQIVSLIVASEPESEEAFVKAVCARVREEGLDVTNDDIVELLRRGDAQDEAAARDVAAQPIDDEALSRVSGGYDACRGEHSCHYILRHDEGDPDDPDHACFHNDLCLAVFTEACRQSPVCTNNYRDLNTVTREIRKKKQG